MPGQDTPAASEALTGPELISELVARAKVSAGAAADATQRRRALLETLTAWQLSPDELAVCADGHDVLGTAYETLLSGAERRDAGQFATPHWAADLMAAWLLREPVRCLLDPGVGSGRLLYRAGIREAAPDKLLGLDVDSVSAELARHNLAFRGLTERAELRVGNFLTDEGLLCDVQPDAVTCNPPYSRTHAIPAEQKVAIHDGFERRLGVKFNRLAALHALFAVRAVEISAPGARLAFITPADWLDAGYGAAVKDWLLDRLDVQAIVLFPEDALPFGSSVMSSAAITLMRKHDRTDGSVGPTRLVRLPAKAVSVEDALAAALGDKRRGIATETVTLSPELKWSRPKAVKRASRGSVPLGELARIRRGLATGSNAFFVLSEAARREHGLSLDDLRPCITGPRMLDGKLRVTAADLNALPDDVPRWALACWRPEAEDEDTPLGAYLRLGREGGVHETYLASKRRPWFGLEKRQPPALLWQYFARETLRFVRNDAGALPTNNWLGIETREGVDPDRLHEVLMRKDVLLRFYEARRSYAGMTKLEPRELAAVRIPWRG